VAGRRAKSDYINCSFDFRNNYSDGEFVEHSELLSMRLIQSQAASVYSYCQCLTDGVRRQILALTCALFHK